MPSTNWAPFEMETWLPVLSFVLFVGHLMNILPHVEVGPSDEPKDSSIRIVSDAERVAETAQMGNTSIRIMEALEAKNPFVGVRVIIGFTGGAFLELGGQGS